MDDKIPQLPSREIRRHIGSSHGRKPYQRGEGGIIDEKLDDRDKKKQAKKRREKERKPNILGGGLAIVSIVIVFLLLKSYPQQGIQVKEVKTEPESDPKAAMAKKRLQSELQKRVDAVKSQTENINALDIAMQSPQVDKVVNDLEAAKSLPNNAQDIVENGAKAADSVSSSLSRLQKIIQDAKSVQQTIVEFLQRL